MILEEQSHREDREDHTLEEIEHTDKNIAVNSIHYRLYLKEVRVL